MWEQNSVAAWTVVALGIAAVVAGLSVIGAGIYRKRIPKKRSVRYETSRKDDNFILIIEGTAEDIIRVKEVLSNMGASETEMHLNNQPIAAVV